MALLFFSTKKNLTKKGSYFTFFFLSFPKVRILKSMSVVVTLCDFFYNISKLMAVIYSDPNLTKNVVKNYTPKKFGNIFHTTFRCPENVSGSGERKKKIFEGGLKMEILNFRTEAPIF